MSKFLRLLTLIQLMLLPFLWCGCASSSPSENRYQSNAGDRPRVDEKYSLTADRQALAEIRTQEPPEKKKENDELAFMIDLFAPREDGKMKDPASIREKFNAAVNKKRSLFDRDISKERERFNTEERKSRDAFLKEQSKERENFQRSKHSHDESSDFYKEQNDKRQEFFANEREKRNDFESDVRERRQDFDDYIREKQNDFNQRYREYSLEYQEKIKHDP